MLMNGLYKSYFSHWLKTVTGRRALGKRSFWAGSALYRPRSWASFRGKYNESLRYLATISTEYLEKPALELSDSKCISIWMYRWYIKRLELLFKLAVSKTPQNRYRELVDANSLRDDDHQRYVIEKLQSLHDQLVNYDPTKLSLSTKSSSMVNIHSTYLIYI